MARVFEPIRLPCGLEVTTSGGLVEVYYKPYRMPKERALAMGPDLARKVAAAILKAADGDFSGMPQEGEPSCDGCEPEQLNFL